MKLVSAIIKPFKLQEVREALVDAGIEGLTITWDDWRIEKDNTIVLFGRTNSMVADLVARINYGAENCEGFNNPFIVRDPNPGYSAAEIAKFTAESGMENNPFPAEYYVKKAECYMKKKSQSCESLNALISDEASTTGSRLEEDWERCSEFSGSLGAGEWELIGSENAGFAKVKFLELSEPSSMLTNLSTLQINTFIEHCKYYNELRPY